MDAYTRETRVWLDQRFKAVDESGVYIAHQPIYGFHALHCEPAVVEKYIRTYQIIKALARLDFNSLLDAGGAEGYRAHIIRDMFGVETRNCDLSEQACRRAWEIFGVESDVADIHHLPYGNNSFDVVLCSESLEHLADFHSGVTELLRVARRAVIITVPHESKEVVDHNIKQGVPHGHIHSFDLGSFDFLAPGDHRIAGRGMVSPWLRFLSSLLPLRRRERSAKYPKQVFDVYNAAVPFLSAILGEWAAAALIRLDERICEMTSRYDAVMFVILKRPGSIRARNAVAVTARRIIGYAAPYHFLENVETQRS